MDSPSDSVMEIPVVLLSIIIGAGLLVVIYVLKFLQPHRRDQDITKNVQGAESSASPTTTTGSSTGGGKLSKKRGHAAGNGSGDFPGSARGGGWRSDKGGFSHPWLLTSLKGHSGIVTDMDLSSNGKFLATCAEDRAVLIWNVKDLTHKEHKSLRVNIEYDHASFVCWSPDNKAFLIHRATDNCIEVYRVDRKKDGTVSAVTKAATFPKHFEQDAVGLDIACSGRFILTCSAGTDLSLFDLKGQLLTTVDTYLMTNSCAKVSPCGRFVVASGFAPDVKVWEVSFNKSGEFQQMARAFELSGHTSGVYDVAFDADTSHIATVSKDGTWKVYDTMIDLDHGRHKEDPRIKITGTYKQCSSPAHIAMSPNGEVVAIATGTTLSVYSVVSGELDGSIENVHSSPITAITFDAEGKYILTAGDKHIRVFHNVTGYRSTILISKKKLLQNQTSATRERLEQLIDDSEHILKSIGENTAFGTCVGESE